MSHELQAYAVDKLMYPSVEMDPYVQAARDFGKGYVFRHGFMVSFETVWLQP